MIFDEPRGSAYISILTVWFTAVAQQTGVEMQTAVFALREAGVLTPPQLKESQQARGRRGRDRWLRWPTWQLAPRLNGNKSAAIVDWFGFADMAHEDDLKLKVFIYFPSMFHEFILNFIEFHWQSEFQTLSERLGCRQDIQNAKTYPTCPIPQDILTTHKSLHCFMYYKYSQLAFLFTVQSNQFNFHKEISQSWLNPWSVEELDVCLPPELLFPVPSLK